MNTPASVGTTAISDVGRDPDRITYRGYSVRDLATRSSFEEVAFLLLRGRLPGPDELHAYRERLRSFRALPTAVRDMIQSMAPDPRPTGVMDELRTAVSYLGSVEPESQFVDALDVADRLVARLPGLAVALHGRGSQEAHAPTETGEPTTSGHLLAMLTGRRPEAPQVRALDASLILYAELAFNASTFACRVCAGTLADLYSCVTTGLATLSGPLHGGASLAVIELLDRFRTPGEARRGVAALLRDRARVPGFGHAVFRGTDPRTPILRETAVTLAGGSDHPILQVAQSVESVMAAEKSLYPNVDFYTACCYRLMQIPRPLYTPLFACARVAGWAAHVMEQRNDRRLIHPVADYTGPPLRPFPDTRSGDAVGDA